MIPRILHYCWFGKNAFPKAERKCMASWGKYFKDYQIIEWNESNFDVHTNMYVSEAYEAKKWAYVSDYARLLALYNYGGIYLDTDVLVKKSFDNLLNYDAFTGFGGDNKEIAAHLLAANKENKFIKEFLDSYQTRSFEIEKGKYDLTSINIMITKKLEKHGFISNGKEQVIDGFRIYPMTYFCPASFAPDTVKDCYSKLTYCDHIWSAPWLKKAKNPLIKFGKAIGLNKLKKLVKL